MNGSVEFREGGKSKKALRIELLIKSYGAAALRGNVRAAEALLKIRENLKGHPTIEPVVLRLSKRDMAVL